MSATRRPLIVGNWKMNGLRSDGAALAIDLAGRMAAKKSPMFDMLVCPPFTLIDKVGEILADSTIALGGQDCHGDKMGAHTGDTSAGMLADAGCTFVIVGHSERRTDHAESSTLVKTKAESGLAAGLSVIVCIGETEAERDAGKTFDVVASQLAGSLPTGASAGNTVVAYEPVWAIGTGRTPEAAEVQEVHALVRRLVAERLGSAEADSLRTLYGGSVKATNAAELMNLPDVDGGLIGGASLKADDFWAIALSCL